MTKPIIRHRPRPLGTIVEPEPTSSTSPASRPVGYEVGFGKPPKQSRWKAGQSGNPRGRPKKSQNLLTILNEVLNEKMTVVVRGRERKISRAEVIIRQSTTRAVEGDIKTLNFLLQQAARQTKVEPEAIQDMTDAERAEGIDGLAALIELARGIDDGSEMP